MGGTLFQFSILSVSESAGGKPAFLTWDAPVDSAAQTLKAFQSSIVNSI
jgi:hypothetical protein